MRKIMKMLGRLLFPTLALLAMPAVYAEPPRLPHGDPWGPRPVAGENPQLLKEGARAYAACASCHLADGSGRPDGAIPRLAGQQAAILEMKLTKIRRGDVFLPVMAAFANSLAPADVTAVSAYLAALPQTKQAGAGDGKALDEGRRGFTANCAACHGAHGEGTPALEAPRLCGQHYGYLLRRVNEIRSRKRADANEGMIAVLATVPEASLTATADWLSRGTCEPWQPSPPGRLTSPSSRAPSAGQGASAPLLRKERGGSETGQ